MNNFYNDTLDFRFHLTHPLMKKIAALKERNFADTESYDYAPSNAEDAIDSYEKVLEIVGDICANIIAKNAEEIDKEGGSKLVDGHVVYARGTAENHDALYKAGLIGMPFPRKYDGLNFPMVPYVMAAEIVARADAAFTNIWGLQDCGETIHEFGNEEQKDKHLPRFNRDGITAAMVLTEPDAGSDLQAVQLKAEFDEDSNTWLLNGVKRFITNGDADIALVLARSESGTSDARGLSLFIYDKTDDACEVRHLEHKLGIIGSPTTELVFKNAPVELLGATRMGLIKYVMALMNSARLGVGAQAVGIADAAYREGYKYAKERKQFGKTIINFPAIYEMLTNMKAQLDGVRSLLYETTRYVDIAKLYQEIGKERKLEKEERMEMKKYSRLSNSFTPLIKLFGSEYANSIAYDSLQIHGGTGFITDFPIERIYRDARITSIYEGTSQLQVVAAIKGVTTGVYSSRIAEFDEMLSANNSMRPQLKEMTTEYNNIVQFVQDLNNHELLDFHARRLVEMAGNIIISYLLVIDSERDDRYTGSASVFTAISASENQGKIHFIRNCKEEDIYKSIID